MRRAQKIPKYDAWVPVMNDFYINDEQVEAFYPFYGDSDKDRDKSSQVYNLMLLDQSKRENDLSDGEPDHTGLSFDHSHTHPDNFDFFQQRRRRAAQRHTILHILNRHGQSPVVWSSLAHTFRMAHRLKQLRLVADVAKRRHDAQLALADRRAILARYTQEVQNELCNPTVQSPPPQSSTHNDFPPHEFPAAYLRHFCFVCHNFGCALHEGKNVAPVNPIPDPTRNARLHDLDNNPSSVCSRRCHRLEDWLQDPVEEDVQGEWTYTEILLLREALALMGEDSCSLATCIGSRSCRQVKERLRNAIDTATDILPTKRRRMDDLGVECDNVDDSDDDRPLHLFRTGNSSPGVVQSAPRAVQQSNNGPDDAEVQDPGLKTRFIPCQHAGPCSRRNKCRCVLNGIDCESVCGCRSGRFCESKNRIVWVDKSNGGGLCKNRHGGCRCKTGSCINNDCPCYVNDRACDPDVCRDCECSLLPEETSMYERRCRNSDIITARHRRVVVGRSKIHGYGLFAGEMFRKGELIGPYCGRLMPSELLDQVLRIAQAKKSTYAFNLTHNLTVDAGLVGSKVKFINHAYNPRDINCVARVERVRGECRICIKANKVIKPGQELLMDYHIVAEEGNDWLIDKEGNNERDSSGEDDNVLPREGGGGNDERERTLVKEESSKVACDVRVAIATVPATGDGGVGCGYDDYDDDDQAETCSDDLRL